MEERNVFSGKKETSVRLKMRGSGAQIIDVANLDAPIAKK